MKSIYYFFALAIILIFSSCTDDSSEITDAGLSDSISITFLDRQNIFDTESTVRRLSIINYNSTKTLNNALTVNGERFLDNGQGYDLIANDNIFTSVELRDPIKSSPLVGQTVISNDFAFYDEIPEERQKKVKFKVGCDINLSFDEGDETLFGNNCSTGCLEITNCSFEFEFEFDIW